MTVDQVKQLVSETVDLIAIDAQSLADAKPRASKFLVAVAVLTDFQRKIEEELPKRQTLLDASYAQAYDSCASKNVTDKKKYAEASESYVQARESLEKLKALHTWIKGHIKIFDNAHLMYRQYSRD